jgi:nicotinate dehydrogenase subunit A
MTVSLDVNGQVRSSDAAPDTPLLYVLRNDLALNGAKYGCGVAQCGACTVLIDGKAVRSCVTAVATAAGKKITTLESLAAAGKLHPLQQAFIDEQAAQCGFCTNGMILTAKAFLERNPQPTEAEICKALAANFCRCGSHNRIVRAVQRAAKAMAGSGGRAAVAAEGAQA